MLTDCQEPIIWTEITPPERIEMLHGESCDDPKTFTSVLTFSPDRAATRIEMHTVFPTRQLATRQSRTTTQSRTASRP